MKVRLRDQRVTHRCVSCGVEREISRGALTMIEKGERGGRCQRCSRAHGAPPAIRPRFKDMLTDQQINEWARDTWQRMSGRERQAVHELAALLDDRRIAA